MANFLMNKAENYGLGTEDTPIFPNMHEASALLVGGTLTAVDDVMTGKHIMHLNLGGGLHHGFRGKASGFCIYNDSSVAIKYIRKNIMHVFYISIQMHIMEMVYNGLFMMIQMYVHYPFMKQDDIYFLVQEMLMNEVKVKAMAIHLIFPSMHLQKMNHGLNVIKQHFTEVAEFFKPDVILTQNGADSHYYDPLTHLSATMKIYKKSQNLPMKLPINIVMGDGLQSAVAAMIFGESFQEHGHIYGSK